MQPRRKSANRVKTKARKSRSRNVAAGSVMKKRRRWPDEKRIPDHSPSRDYREGPDDQGKSEHSGLPGGSEGDQDGNQGSGADDFQSEGAFRAHGHISGKRAAARKVCRLPSGLEESVRAIAQWREDAGVRAEFVRSRRDVARYVLPMGVVQQLESETLQATSLREKICR